MHRIIFFIALFVLAPLSSARAQQESSVEWGPWWVLLPFEHNAGASNISKSHAPEKKLKTWRAGSSGPNLNAKFKGRDKREITWRQVRESSAEAPDFGLLDFVELVGGSGYANKQAASNNAVAYAYRTLTSSLSQNLYVTFGSDDSCRIWLNGKLIHDLVAARGVNPAEDKLTLKLAKGINHLLVKVSNGGGAWGAQMQLPLSTERTQRPLVSPDAINASIDRGMVFLLRTQLLDGSWEFDQKNFRNGQTSLAVYALLKSGLRPDHPAIQRGFAFLNLHPPRKTYSLVCQMLALYSTKGSAERSLMMEFGAELEDWEDQAFAYPNGAADLSNTQYGSLGLWVYFGLGGRISERTLTRVLRFTLDCQGPDGGFGYRARGTVSGSMTVAGLTSIRACELALGKKGLPNNLKKDTLVAKATGLAWLDENFRVDRNPATTGADRWGFYYLYGVERLAALFDLEEIGGLDWYQEGASYLVGAQGAEGNWATAYGESGPNTAFALLFLSRSTATLSGKRKFNRHQRTYGTDTNDAQLVLRAAGDTPLDLWISEIHPDVLKKHSRDGSGGNGLYIERVEYLSDGEVIQTADGDTSKPWKTERFAFQHTFAARGFHEMQVRVHLAPEPGKEGAAAAVIASPSMTVRVDELMEDWMLEYPGDELKNLGLLTAVTATASSMRGAGDAPNRTVDGNLASGWTCEAGDADPTLTLRYKRPVRADRIVLSHRTSKELWRTQFDRATKVELLVKGRKEPILVDMDPNEEHKTVVMLPKEMRVSEVRIRVLERLKATKHFGCVGFAEVELRLGD